MSILKRAATPRIAVALFFAALVLIGLFTAGDYGLPCDEPAEQVILRENLHEYATRFLGGQSDAVRYYQDMGIDRISQSIERDHGQSAYYLFTPLLARYAAQPDTLTTLWHGYTWLLFTLGAWALYALCRHTGLSRAMSCLGVLLYAGCPRFFAEGHYNNKDMALLSLCLTVLWLGARFLKQPGFLRGLCFSFVGAMATNTKIVGAFPWALMGLAAIVLLTARRAWSGRMALVAAVTVLGYLAFYALLTPALLADPAGYIAYLWQNATGFTRWTGVVIFRGARYEPAVSPLPHSYLPYLMLCTLPLFVTAFCAIGQLSAVRKLCQHDASKDERALTLAAATLVWLVPLAFAVIRQPVLYNGWRHFYFIFAGLAPLCAHGLNALWQFMKKRGKWPRRLTAVLVGAIFCLNAAGIVLNHPCQYAYYNPLVRANAETDMELDYWDVSTVNAMKQLIAADRNAQLPLTLGALDDMSWFGVEHGYEVLTPQEKAALSIVYEPDAPYLFANTTYALIYGTTVPEGYHEMFTLESYGNTLCTVYERDR